MDLHLRAETDMGSLRYLADLNGVATGFWDWYGNHKAVSAQSLLKVLHALGVEVDEDSTVGDVQVAIEETQARPWRRLLPATVVAREGVDATFNVHVKDGQWVNVSWVSENGQRGECAQTDNWEEPRQIDGEWIGEASFIVPGTLPVGWHRLEATDESGRFATATLIVTPQRLVVPTDDHQRRWGIACQMYSTRSAGSWGMGDAADLEDLIAVSARKGADFALINPIHASAPLTPIESSPYLPVTRRWVNPIYIRPEKINEFATLPLRQQIEAKELRDSAATAGTHLIDRDATWNAKEPILRYVYAQPRSLARQAQLDKFTQSGGEDLYRFALWSALVKRHGRLDLPEELAHAEAPGVQKAAVDLADDIKFYTWCQWVASTQFKDAQHVARTLGMDIGIMADLAVGVHPLGSEKWSNPGLFATGMSVGAPPDMYSQQGQDWSQPPWSPRALAEAGYAPLRHMVQAALAHAGALRIDHILGLFRLWWIPQGEGAAAGTYVYYDHEAMLGVILVEAQRCGAQIIGEDLGTVEPWVREYLKDRGVMGTSILWFEKDEQGEPLHARNYRKDCLAAVTTHDLPPTAGYLQGVQTTLRDELGLLVDPVENIRAADQEEQDRMTDRLREYRLLPDGEVSVEDYVIALHRFLTHSSARLVLASLVDAVGDLRPQNLPGTYREYPNWRVPLCDASGEEVFVEDLPDHAGFARLAEALDTSLHRS